MQTINRKRASQRLCESPIEIALFYNPETSVIDIQPLKRPFLGHANFQVIFLGKIVTWKTVIPLQYLLKGWGDANRGYQGYSHSIAQNMSQMRSFYDIQQMERSRSNVYSYVGITSRNWLIRFQEHMGNMGRGSMLRFYRAWRETMGVEDVHFISELIEINMTEDEALDWEESIVDKIGPNRLNMIPGGRKGLRFLHEHRITDRVNITLKEREKAILDYIRKNPRKGIPNPFIAELWKDDDFYLKVIEARPKTLSQEQVRKIREMGKMGRPTSEIVKEVGALNEVQVKKVIKGKTYRRMH
ncbi:MAG: hypothetical protein U5P10_07925 [Spirochaetia bacterium]|nr:hypothetical protein [Spirochaetia bacterium]